MACWDQWYPEAAHLMALAGAELLIYPTAIGYDPDDSLKELLYAEIDLNRSEQLWPFFRDRRIDTYQGLKLRFCD
jgi:predicted amidohydrolase